MSNPDDVAEPVRPGAGGPASAQIAGFPPGIPFIIGNEAAERFSFYGLRAILYVYLVEMYLGFLPRETVPELIAAAEVKATKVHHLFIAGVYAAPMIGAILADRLLGKYRVILWVSLLYCVGHGILALMGKMEWGVYTGLACIALGAGGIKPCVSANVGDQFSAANAHLVPSVFRIFYFSVNFGSFFANLLIPWIKREYGQEAAFAVPGILMGIATLVFWLGRHRFVKVPPSPGGKLGLLDFLGASCLFLAFAVFVFTEDGHYWLKTAAAAGFLALWFVISRIRQRIEEDRGFLAVLTFAVRNQTLRRPGMGFLDVVREKFGEESAEGSRAVLRIMLVFSMVCVFWALFDQHSSTWTQQARKMDLTLRQPDIAASFEAGGLVWSEITLEAAQIQAMNPGLVMLIIPVLALGIFRPLERRGIIVKPLVRMTIGMFLASLSFVAVALIERGIDAAASHGSRITFFWQLIPYILLTTGEVLVSVTGLEFAYTQAPRSMKSTIMGFWYLCVTVGNLLVAALSPLLERSLATLFWTFAVLMLAAAIVFALLARLYRGKTYLQDGSTG
ncbi:MAG TPA: oligopeptide:H+ symporter [Planctomycetota bacterium]|nr:oligopeptide:H+ symporter [Planctomycetota bacterium]